MSLKEKLRQDLRVATLDGDEQKRSVTRMLLSELNYAERVKNSSLDGDNLVVETMQKYYQRLRRQLGMPLMNHKKIEYELSVVEDYLSYMKLAVKQYN